MTMSPYPSKREEFISRYPDYRMNGVSQLNSTGINGSGWTWQHLRALRVLLVSAAGDGNLTFLQPHMDSARRRLQGSFLAEGLDQIDEHEISTLPHGELWRRGGRLGFFYQSLATVLELESFTSMTVREHPSRERQAPSRPGYETGEAHDLSSPPRSSPPSSPSYAPSEQLPADDLPRNLLRKPEVAASTLLYAFLSLTSRLTNQTREGPALEFTNVPTILQIRLKTLTDTCTDDGSLIFRGEQDRSWLRKDSLVYCGLEAKAAYAPSAKRHDEEEHVVLAQQVSMMVAMISQRMQIRDDLDEFMRT